MKAHLGRGFEPHKCVKIVLFVTKGPFHRGTESINSLLDHNALAFARLRTHMVTAPKPRLRRSRYERAASPIPLNRTRRDEEICAALRDFGFLSTIQLCSWVFGSLTALPYLRERVRKLFDARELHRQFLIEQPRGSPTTVHSLKPRNHHYRSQLFMRHTLEANELLVLARKLTQASPGFHLARVFTEYQLKRIPIYVASNSHKQAVIADAFIDLRTPEQHCVAFELDRDTAFRDPICAKVEGWLEAERGPYQDWAGADRLTVAFVVTQGGERRVTQLLNWTENVLRETGRQLSADLFRFAAFDPATANPEQVFFRPIWKRPFEQQLVPLIQGG